MGIVLVTGIIVLAIGIYAWYFSGPRVGPLLNNEQRASMRRRKHDKSNRG